MSTGLSIKDEGKTVERPGNQLSLLITYGQIQGRAHLVFLKHSQMDTRKGKAVGKQGWKSMARQRRTIHLTSNVTNGTQQGNAPGF